MKPETLFELASRGQTLVERQREVARRLEEMNRAKKRLISKAQKELDTLITEIHDLEAEDPGPVVEREPRSELERFDAMMTDLVKLSEPTLNKDRSPPDPRDKSRRRTPTLSIARDHQGENRTLKFHLEIDTRTRSQSISAYWEAPGLTDGTSGPYREHLHRDFLERNIDFRGNLNSVEWSVATFMETARGLTPDEAEELGFSEESVEELKNSMPKTAAL